MADFDLNSLSDQSLNGTISFLFSFNQVYRSLQVRPSYTDKYFYKYNTNKKKLALAFNQPGHSIADMGLIPLELQPTLSRSRLQEAREAYLIDRGKTLSPDGLKRRNEH